MRTLAGVLPWAVVLVVAGAAIWFLYDRNVAAWRWLFAGVLVAHGLIHLLFLVPTPEASTAGGPDWPFDLGRPWLVTSAGLAVGLMRAVGIALIAAVVVGFGLTGLSTLGVVVPASLWPGLVVGSSVLSLLLLALFFAPSLMAGVVLDAALIWLALVMHWDPTRA